ncbi:MAG: DUF4332 domain-containing protein [Chloroflexota bacterium]|nr:DUF4332 domain-containing protein [Chloroflexota bacterium]
MANDNDKLVIGYYTNHAAAEEAAHELKDWDKHNDNVKLGAVAIMAIDPKSGELEAKEVGQRKTKGGALWGTVIGGALGLLTGGIGLIPGLILGAGGGAAIGALFHKDVGMSDADQAKLVEYLRQGGAALAIMADDFEVEPTKAEMVRIGGTVEAYDVPEETASVLVDSADAMKDAAAAADEAIDNVADDVTEGASKAVAALPDLAPESAAAVSALVAVSGLSAADAAKLHADEVDVPSELLKRGATPKGRLELEEATGIDHDVILTAVKKLDLMRIKGVGYKHAALLLASGVHTVPDLATRNPENLHARMVAVNAVENIVTPLPSAETVAGWVDQAKELPRMIYYQD